MGCSFGSCENRLLAKGLCSFHYHRQRRGVPLDAPRGTLERRTKNRLPPPPDGKCVVDGCGSPHKARQLCRFHYQRSMTGVPLDKPKRGRGCRVDGCEATKVVSVEEQLCSKHMHRLRAGHPLDYPGTLHGRHSVKPLGHRTPNGKYMNIKTDRGMEPEHRVVMRQHLGRELLDHETVHHLNGDGRDNRLENLELWSTSQPQGQRVADKTAWAEWWLGVYKPEAREGSILT